MIGTIFSLLTGGGFQTISNITNKLADVRRDIALAKNDVDKARLEQTADVLERQLETKERAQATFGVATVMRAGFALPFMAYLWKIIIYDKIIMDGTTATTALGANEADLMKVVVSFYFLTEIGLGTFRALPLLRGRKR